jgi:hypothetical protein
MIRDIRTKQDLIKWLGGKELRYVDNLEVVNENDVRSLANKTRTFLRRGKKLQIVVIERD